MDEYLIGIVKEFFQDKILFECNNHGLILEGVNLHLLALNQNLKLYVYFYQKPPITKYFAFVNQQTKQYFLELIMINNIGPKTALKILNFFSLKEFQTAINNYDIVHLQKCKTINKKMALAIKEHFSYKKDLYQLNHQLQEKWMLIFNTLLKLGFTKDTINKYLSSINWDNDLQVIINQAIKTIGNNYY